MDDLFEQLEKRIYAVLQAHERLQTMNQHLRHDKSMIAEDHEQLLMKHKNAVMQIEKMVARLKSIEGLS